MKVPPLQRLLVSSLLVAGMFAAAQRPAFGEARPQAASSPAGSAQEAPQQGQEKQQPPNGYSISVTVPVVNVDVDVTDDNGDYLTGLKKDNFRITEDGVTQKISNFSATDAPITVVLLIEYSRLGYGWFLYNGTSWADIFLHDLRPTDWVAVQSFSMRPKLEIDFTHNTEQVDEVLRSMVLPTFSETDLFDAVLDTLDRMRGVHGKKAILLLASGLDTFSHHNLGQVIGRLRETDTPIFCVGVGEQLFLVSDVPGGMSDTQRLGYLQAKNQLDTFARLTGGRAWFPRFQAEIPGVMADVAASLRNQYSLAYTPMNQEMDGKFRKIKVELVAPDGGPLTVVNKKGKKVKYRVYAREGYLAPKSNVTD
jgi:VWFA-related protein